MVVGVVAVSFVKPMAFSRYFVVLPAVLPVLAVQIGALELNRCGRGFGLVVLVLMLISYGGQDSESWMPALPVCANRTSSVDQPAHQWFGRALHPRQRLFNLSDRMEVAMGRIPSPPVPWGGKADLKQRLLGQDPPQQLWLASSGPPQAMERSSNPCSHC